MIYASRVRNVIDDKQKADEGKIESWLTMLEDCQTLMDSPHPVHPKVPTRTKSNSHLSHLFNYICNIFTFFHDLIHLWADQSPDLIYIYIYIFIYIYISMLVRSADRHIRRSL